MDSIRCTRQTEEQSTLATSELARERDGVMGQPSPQDVRPLQCLLLEYPQTQRQENLGNPRGNHLSWWHHLLHRQNMTWPEQSHRMALENTEVKMSARGTTFVGSVCQVLPGFSPTLHFRAEIFHPRVFFFPSFSANSHSQRDKER